MAYELPQNVIGNLIATATLAAKQYYAVKVDASNDNAVVIGTAGAACLGILSNAPAAAEAASVITSGEAKAIIGGSVTRGDKLSSDSAGKLVTSSGSAESFAIALQSGSTNDIITVLLTSTQPVEIGTSQLANLSVTTAKIATGAVTATQIADGTVVAAEIATSAVTTIKIAPLAVTSAKIGTAAVVEAKIGTGAVTLAKIASASRTRAFIPLALELRHISTNADVITAYKPGFAGKIVKVDFLTTARVDTAAKIAVLNCEIDTTNLTGGVLTLSSALMSSIGKVISGTAVTGNNTFTAAATISVEATSVTAFVEGAGVLMLVVEQAQ